MVEEGLSVFRSVGTLVDLLGAAGNNINKPLEPYPRERASMPLEQCT